MARLIVLLAVAAGLYLLFRWLSRQPPRVVWQFLAVLVAVVLLVLVLTGRAHWLTAVFAALLPFARGLINLLGALPLLRRVLAGVRGVGARTAPSGGQRSTVQSRYLRMTLNHDSGDIDGEVLEGRFRGGRLSRLGLETLLELLAECAGDEESVALLQAYLDRVHGDDWRRRAGAGEAGAAAAAPADMTREEALQVLGLEPGADEAAIVEAHRRLMQKLHPDRGGSAYLAATINLAKETLLSG